MNYKKEATNIRRDTYVAREAVPRHDEKAEQLSALLLPRLILVAKKDKPLTAIDSHLNNFKNT